MQNKTIIIGFGYKARRGKDTACHTILEARSHWVQSVKKYAFADALREEIERRLWLYMQAAKGDVQKAMQMLCTWAQVEYDAFAVADTSYPYGKQRALTQWWGTEYRRAKDPDYWVKKLAAKIERDKPEVALISDVRFHNEFEYITAAGGHTVRVDRPGFEIADGKHHISEVGLDLLPDEAWSHILTNLGDTSFQACVLSYFDGVMGL